MMSSHPIFSKPVWQHFLHLDGIHSLPMPALIAADMLFEEIKKTGTTEPKASDYVIWAQKFAADDPSGWMQHLLVAAAIILPSETGNITAAKTLLKAHAAQIIPKSKPETAQKPRDYWDPCARPDRPLRGSMIRDVSVYPWELPDAWQAALRRAAKGLPGHETAPPRHAILQRMRDKLCQLAWSACKAGLAPDLTEEVVCQYLQDLETRLRARPTGIRWATLRATVEELHRFARYTGTFPEEDLKYLSRRLSRYTLLEKGQDALKFYALLETGNTTHGLLNQADDLLEQAAREGKPLQRHRLRNAAAILGLYSIVPLRNSDADLILGDTLLWESGTWIIDTMIKKTATHNPEPLVVPLESEFARYIDIVILGDFNQRHLPELRAKAAQTMRPLFVKPDGSVPHKTYIARIFKEQTGNSFTTTRTMLHTDQAMSRGEAGTRDAMAACHQTSPKTAKKYQEKRVRTVAINRVQDAAARRRADLIAPDILDAIQNLKAYKEGDNT
jgi:hypothetical protein